MPLYEYECAGCGPFAVFRLMAEYALPANCPTCSLEAPRALACVPAMIASGGLRPAVSASSASAGASGFGRHSGGCRCGCGSGAKIRRADWVRKLL